MCFRYDAVTFHIRSSTDRSRKIWTCCFVIKVNSSKAPAGARWLNGRNVLLFKQVCGRVKRCLGPRLLVTTVLTGQTARQVQHSRRPRLHQRCVKTTKRTTSSGLTAVGSLVSHGPGIEKTTGKSRAQHILQKKRPHSLNKSSEKAEYKPLKDVRCQMLRVGLLQTWITCSWDNQGNLATSGSDDINLLCILTASCARRGTVPISVQKAERPGFT